MRFAVININLTGHAEFYLSPQYHLPELRGGQSSQRAQSFFYWDTPVKWFPDFIGRADLTDKPR